MTYQISKMDRPEPCGDWHDKPSRWIVSGISRSNYGPVQKFSTRDEARHYVSLCRKYGETEGSRRYVRGE